MYRATQQWNHWLTQFMGNSVLLAEEMFLRKLLANYFGKQTLLLGVPHQERLLSASVTHDTFLLTSIVSKVRTARTIEGEFYELPILSGSVDLVLLPHTLEYVDNPHKLLSEACRIVKPEGHIVILGFNPLSMWGLKKLLSQRHTVPWSKNFIKASTVKNWLGLSDFELVKQDTLIFRPPLQNPNVFRRLQFLEWFGRKIYKPFGGVYLLVAQAKVIPLTPIRLRWQQSLSDIRITLPGPSMRGSK